MLSSLKSGGTSTLIDLWASLRSFGTDGSSEHSTKGITTDLTSSTDRLEFNQTSPRTPTELSPKSCSSLSELLKAHPIHHLNGTKEGYPPPYTLYIKSKFPLDLGGTATRTLCSNCLVEDAPVTFTQSVDMDSKKSTNYKTIAIERNNTPYEVSKLNSDELARRERSLPTGPLAPTMNLQKTFSMKDIPYEPNSWNEHVVNSDTSTRPTLSNLGDNEHQACFCFRDAFKELAQVGENSTWYNGENTSRVSSNKIYSRGG